MRLWRQFLLFLFVCSPSALPDAQTARTRPSGMVMKATAYSQEQNPTAAGTAPHEGIVAADPDVLPLGTRIRISGAGPYNGVYVVTDTGAKVQGRHIDVYLASDREAKEFGVKRVRVHVLEVGEGRRDAREKDSIGAP
jgi:3D (Asp-Asp-Asp) domain-containing protein